MSVLRQGRIVFVRMLDPQGRNPKVRPGVIITPTDQIVVGGFVRVVAITSQCGEAPRELVVDIPWDRNGHPKTKLRRPSEAVCDWAELIPVDELSDTGGFVPTVRLLAVQRIVAALDANQPPPAPPPPG